MAANSTFIWDKSVDWADVRAVVKSEIAHSKNDYINQSLAGLSSSVFASSLHLHHTV